MLKSVGPLALAVTLAAGAGQAAAVEKQTLTLTNTSSRIVECALLVDGKTRTMLKIRPGKAYADAFDPRRGLQLVCERAKKGVWEVKAGTGYNFVDGDRRVGLAEAAGQ